MTPLIALKLLNRNLALLLLTISFLPACQLNKHYLDVPDIVHQERSSYDQQIPGTKVFFPIPAGNRSAVHLPGRSRDDVSVGHCRRGSPGG